MDLSILINDMTPEELEPRLELQILTDPLSASIGNFTDNNNNCKVVGACNIQLPS
jgi:hypothetical protein